MKQFRIIDGGDRHISTANERQLIELAWYYYDNSDETEIINLDILENAIKFVERVDIVEEVFPTDLYEFKRHLSNTLTEIHEALDNDGDLSKFDVTIKVNGKSVVLPLHADLYSRLERIIEEEIEENER